MTGTPRMPPALNVVITDDEVLGSPINAITTAAKTSTLANTLMLSEAFRETVGAASNFMPLKPKRRRSGMFRFVALNCVAVLFRARSEVF
ncbi:MAG: hypothetical protein ACLPYS_02295 [Vulcanimicrobiaceae bacterium]